jgi:hypothetical protein
MKILSKNRSAITHSFLFIYLIAASILLASGSTAWNLCEAQASVVDIASEKFEAHSWHIGKGWSDAWYHEGNASIVSSGGPYSGTYHMRLRAGDAWTDRPLNLSCLNNARLGLFVKVKSFEKKDYAELMISPGGNRWETLRRFTSADSDNDYHYYEFDLTPYGLTSTVSIGFEAEMSGKKDYLYVDDIRVFTKTAWSAEPIFGVTIDDISNPSAIKKSLSSLARYPFARIVFDEYVQAAYYKDTVRDFHAVAGIMGEILDSYYVKEYSQKAYEQRTRNYVQAMAEDVDIWEVGNEINGEWLGQGAMDKAAAAYDIVNAAGEPAALTLYYNGSYDNGTPTAYNCWESPKHQMHVWAQKNVPKRMKEGLDWVLVSFYEEDCENISPDWDQVFADLHEIFPNSKLGFGEVGTRNNSQKEEILRRYYSMHRIRPEFIGGFFWWYYKQDMTPNKTKLWNILNDYAQSWDKQYN